MAIHYNSAELVDDNILLVDVDCPRCGASCRCEDGCDDVALYDLTILLRNLAIVGALTRSFRLGDVYAWSMAWSDVNFASQHTDEWRPNIDGKAAL